MVDLQAACYGIVSTFFVASTFSILLRIYSRGFVVNSFGWDDWCMTAILVCCLQQDLKRTLANEKQFFNCGQQFLLYYFIHYGGGL